MRNKKEIDELITDVERRLEAKRSETGLNLYVPEGGYLADDKWLSIIVTPKEPGVRASFYVEVLGEVNDDLRASGVEHVLLVPAIVND